MKIRIGLLFLLLGVTSAVALATTEPLLPAQTFTFKVSPWKSSCQLGLDGKRLQCSPAISSAEPRQVTVVTKPVFNPQQADRIVTLLEFPEISARLTVWTVSPPESKHQPLHFNVQIELESPVRALCVHAIRVRDPMEFPPLVCGGVEESSLTRQGMTLEFLKPAQRL
jgi:hypothetical protein